MKRDFKTEFVFITSRSSGSGGQHVNKVNSKVELRFDVFNTILLDEEAKELIIKNLHNIITKEGILQIVSQKSRSQTRNKKDCIEKFYKIIEKALQVPKVRKKQKPSKTWHAKRLKEKKQKSERKQRRSKNFNSLF